MSRIRTKQHEYQRTPAPLTVPELHWIAGFLLGEGSFVRYRVAALRVTANQKERAPLEHLQALVGGRLYLHQKSGVNRVPIWSWYLSGPQAIGLMMTLAVILQHSSPRRFARITEHLRAWRATPRPGFQNRGKTHCKHGHPFTPENTITISRGRACKECGRRRARDYQRRERGAA